MPDDSFFPTFTPPDSFDSPDSSAPRRRGAPKGNQNARKYGFYSKRPPARARNDLEDASFSGLRAEIDLIRALIGDILDHAGEVKTIDQRIDLLRAVTAATVSISRLLRAGPELDKEEGMNKGLQMALDKVLADMAAKGQRP